MKRTTVLTLIIIFLFFVAGASFYLVRETDTVTARVVQEELVNVKIGYRDHLLYLPAYVALKRNYYTDEGLLVELVRFDSTNQLVEATIAGHVDAAVGGVNAVVPLTIEGKTPGVLKVFNLGYITDDFDALLVAQSSDMNEVKDLEGKIVAAIPGTTAKIWMNRMLKQEHLDGKVKIIQIADSQQLNALQSGSADAIFVLEPLKTIAEEKNIGRTLVKSPIAKYFRSNLLFETSIMSTEFIQKNPRTAQKIIRAIDKAIVFINEHPDIAKTYYSEFTPVEDALEDKLPVSTYVASHQMKEKEFQDAATLFFTSGLIESDVNVSPIMIG